MHRCLKYHNLISLQTLYVYVVIKRLESWILFYFQPQWFFFFLSQTDIAVFQIYFKFLGFDDDACWTALPHLVVGEGLSELLAHQEVVSGQLHGRMRRAQGAGGWGGGDRIQTSVTHTQSRSLWVNISKVMFRLSFLPLLLLLFPHRVVLF